MSSSSALASARSVVTDPQRLTWICALAMAGLSVLLALPYLNHAPLYDEFFTLLAGRGLLDTGTPQIADGQYPRALAFSAVQALLFAVFGESFVVARLPSLVSVALVTATLFVVVRRVSTLPAALIATAVFATTPLTIEMSQFGRFYAPHGLLVWVASVLVFLAADTSSLRRMLLLAIPAVAALALAYHLQSTTAIVVFALGAWGAGIAALRFMRLEIPRKLKLTIALSVVAAGLAAGALVLLSDLGAFLVGQFRAAPVWAAGRANEIRFYHQLLNGDLGIFWSLFPIAAVAAVLYRPREALFACCFVAITLILQSLAAQKAGRYVFYILPFICGIIGVGLASILSGYFDWVRTRAAKALPANVAESRPVLWGVAAIATGALAFPVVNNATTEDILRMLAGSRSVESIDYSEVANWSVEGQLLRDHAAEAEILVTSSGIKAVYYLGDFDFELNASTTPETDTSGEFGTDLRTGRRVFSQPESLQRLLACYSDIAFILDESRWARDSAVPIATSALLESKAELVGTRPEAGIRVFRYRGSPETTDSSACDLG